MSELAATGAVYDRGYRPYDGARGGRHACRLALARQSMRRALGLRRPWRQKVLPWGLLVVATLPAVVNVGVGYVSRNTPVEGFEFFTYRDYVGVSTALLLFVALTAPDVVAPDRRHRVLPLIFARPLTGADYVLAKVGAVAAIVFGFGFLPHVVLFVGQMLVTRDGALDYFTEHAEVLWQVPLSVAALAIYYAALGVALSAVSSRRIVGAVALIGVFLVTSTVAAVLVEVAGGESRWALLNLYSLPLYVRDLIFLGHIDSTSDLAYIGGAGLAAVALYLAIVAASVGSLLHRYRDDG